MKAILLTSLLLIAGHASATTFQFEDLAANNGGSVGDKLDSVTSTFNDSTERFTWDVTFNQNPTPIDGFWLVVNNGPNPKQSDVNELAIMYGDMDTGILSTYAYNGQNNANSINTPGILLQTDTFTTGPDSLSIDIDATAINAWSAIETAPDYTGIAFDDNIGIWFHISTGSNFGYNQAQDTITSYSFGSQGWYDRSWLTTTSVPEPATMLMLGLAMLGFGTYRKRTAQ